MSVRFMVQRVIISKWCPMCNSSLACPSTWSRTVQLHPFTISGNFSVWIVIHAFLAKGQPIIDWVHPLSICAVASVSSCSPAPCNWMWKSLGLFLVEDLSILGDLFFAWDLVCVVLHFSWVITSVFFDVLASLHEFVLIYPDWATFMTGQLENPPKLHTSSYWGTAFLQSGPLPCLSSYWLMAPIEFD